MYPRGLSGPPVVTFTIVVEVKCACHLYEGSICHRLNVYKMKNGIHEARGKKEFNFNMRCAWHRLVVSFWDCYYSDGKLMPL